MAPHLLDPRHRLFSVLPPSDLEAARRIARRVQLPGSPTGVSRLLDRAAASLALLDLPALCGPSLLQARDLLVRWAGLSRDASTEVSAFYHTPVERDAHAANPAHGLKTSHPIFACLVCPPLIPSCEALFLRILSTILCVRLGADEQSAAQDRALDLATLLRQRAEGTLGVLEKLASSLGMNEEAKPFFHPRRLAAIYIRARKRLADTSLSAEARELLRQWLALMEWLGPLETGKGLSSAEPPPGGPCPAIRTPVPGGAFVDTYPVAAPADDGDESESDPLTLGADTPPGQPEPSEEEAAREANRLWTATTRASTSFPISWNRLNDQELKILEESLAKLGEDTGAAIIRSGLACGLRPDAIARQLDRTEEAEQEDKFTVRAVGSLLYIERELKARALPRAYVPKDDDRYVPATGRIRLRGPHIPAPMHKSGTYGEALDEALRACRADLRIRLSHGRIARTLLGDFLGACPDPYVADLIFPSPSVQLLSGAGHYAARHASQVAEKLQHPTRRPGAWIQASGEFMGSQAIPTREAFRLAVVELRARLDEARATIETAAGLSRFHNLFVAMELVLLMTGSSHRLVTDPFPYEDCLIREEGLFIIADKVSTRSHGTRLSVAAAETHSQWTKHRAHLRELASRMDYLGAADAGRVHGLVDKLAPATAPFFFFLSPALELCSITPGSFALQTEGRWTWPTSAHRQFMASALRERNCPAELIHAHLGHWLRGEAPFSPRSFLRPSQLVAHLGDAIQDALVDVGLRAVDGLPTAGTYRRFRTASEVPAPWPSLGPIGRADRRRQGGVTATEAGEQALAVRCWMMDVDIEARRPDIVPKEAVDHARSDLMLEFDTDIERMNGSLRALRDTCVKLRRRGWSIWIPGAPFAPMDPPPVVADFSGRSVRASREIRDAFLAWLERSLPSLDDQDLHAATLMAAVTLGGLLAPSLWNRFLVAVKDGPWRIASVDWLELGPDGTAGTRFIGDSVTRGLIRLAQRKPTPVAFDVLKKRANALFREMTRGIRLPIHDPAAPGASASIKGLAHVVPCLIDDLACRSSGLALSHMKGQSRSWTTPPEHFCRLLAGKALALKDEQQADLVDESLLEEGPATLKDPTARDKQADRFLKILLRSQSDAIARHEPSDRGRRRTKRRNDLENDLEDFVAALRKEGCAPVLFRLVQFALHLVREGGLQCDDLSPVTIRSYAGVGVDDLMRAFGDRDPIDLDDEDRGSAYLRSFKDSSDIASRAKHLRYFDLFLCDAFDLDPVDWFDRGLMLPTARMIDAEFPTARDIGRIDALSQQLTLGGPVDLASALFLTVASRTGLRSGEIHRLSFHDLLLGPDPIVLVHNSSAGETKSAAGIRQAPWLEPPGHDDAAARAALDVVGRARTAAEHADGTAIQRSSGVSRGGLGARIRGALAAATGNARSRPHHLRHAWAGHVALLAADLPHPVVLSALGNITPDCYRERVTDVRRRLTGRPHPTPLQHEAIATGIGHRDFGITETHYVHVLDLIAAAEVDAALPPISPELASSLLGIKANALYQARNRAKARGHDPSYPGILLGRQAVDGAPRNASLPDFAEQPNTFQTASHRVAICERPLWELAELLGHVRAGSDEADLIAHHALSSDEARRVVAACADMQTFFRDRVAEARDDHPPTGTSLRRSVQQACSAFCGPDGQPFWAHRHDVADAERVLACWYPSRRMFESGNEAAEASVDRWLHFAGLNAVKNRSGKEAQYRFERLSRKDGTRLSNLVLIAYLCEFRRRCCPD